LRPIIITGIEGAYHPLPVQTKKNFAIIPAYHFLSVTYLQDFIWNKNSHILAGCRKKATINREKYDCPFSHYPS
jgi:hypothetical protein